MTQQHEHRSHTGRPVDPGDPIVIEELGAALDAAAEQIVAQPVPDPAATGDQADVAVRTLLAAADQVAARRAALRSQAETLDALGGALENDLRNRAMTFARMVEKFSALADGELALLKQRGRS